MQTNPKRLCFSQQKQESFLLVFVREESLIHGVCMYGIHKQLFPMHCWTYKRGKAKFHSTPRLCEK